jgi:phage gpG-like protein
MAKVNMKFKGKSPSKMAYEIETKAKKAVLEQIKVAALEQFDDSFDKQGFEGSPWKPRKAPLTGLKSWDKWNSGRAVLIGQGGQGGLRGSIKGTIIQRSGIVRVASNKVYAAVHNEGLRAGRGRGFTMPKRQFIGDSAGLMRKIEGIIHRNINPILK